MGARNTQLRCWSSVAPPGLGSVRFWTTAGCGCDRCPHKSPPRPQPGCLYASSAPASRAHYPLDVMPRRPAARASPPRSQASSVRAPRGLPPRGAGSLTATRWPPVPPPPRRWPSRSSSTAQPGRMGSRGTRTSAAPWWTCSPSTAAWATRCRRSRTGIAEARSAGTRLSPGRRATVNTRSESRCSATW